MCMFNARLFTSTCVFLGQSSQPPDDHSPLTRKEFIRFLLATTTKSELRCQVGQNQRINLSYSWISKMWYSLAGKRTILDSWFQFLGLCWGLHWNMGNPGNVSLWSVRVSTLTVQTCPAWICATSISRWPTWEESTWATLTWAGQTWREQTCPWPASMWVLFFIQHHLFGSKDLYPPVLFLCPSMQAANLQGVKMLCTNAEGASLKGCNFEDPAGIKANLEGEAADSMFSFCLGFFFQTDLGRKGFWGAHVNVCVLVAGANLKGVDMEGSQMTGINLRVATLKNAKLKNCNLRGATLAGTDLEVRTHTRTHTHYRFLLKPAYLKSEWFTQVLHLFFLPRTVTYQDVTFRKQTWEAPTWRVPSLRRCWLLCTCLRACGKTHCHLRSRALNHNTLSLRRRVGLSSRETRVSWLKPLQPSKLWLSQICLPLHNLKPSVSIYFPERFHTSGRQKRIIGTSSRPCFVPSIYHVMY